MLKRTCLQIFPKSAQADFVHLQGAVSTAGCFLSLSAALLICSLGVTYGRGHNQAPPAEAITASQRESFHLGFLLALPTAQGESYARAVRSLQEIPDGPEADKRIATLDTMASDLRSGEAHTYTEVGTLLTQISAPPTLTQWLDRSNKRLATEIGQSPFAKSYTSEPTSVAHILTTLDESVDLKKQRDTYEIPLTTWLKLSHGTSAVWAYHLGALMAGIQVSLATLETTHPSSAAAARLLQTAPAGTPQAVRKYLSELVTSQAVDTTGTVTVIGKAGMVKDYLAAIHAFEEAK